MKRRIERFARKKEEIVMKMIEDEKRTLPAFLMTRIIPIWTNWIFISGWTSKYDAMIREKR
jgi:hypothetical protein